jgi:hypothetical protein
MAEEIEVQNQEETAGIDDEQATNVNEKQLEEHTSIMNLKGEKRSAKSRMTRLLNNMAAMLSDSNTEQKDVKELLLRIDEQKDETLHIMNQLENIYQRSKEYENAKKVNDEADALVDQVEYETSSARMFLTSLAKKQWGSSAVTVTSSKESNVGETSKQRQDEDERRKNAELWARMRNEAEVQKKRELLEEQERQLRTAEEQAEKTRQELGVLEKGNNEDKGNQQNSEQPNTVERIEVNETLMRTDQISLPANSNTPTRGAGATTSQAEKQRDPSRKLYNSSIMENVIPVRIASIEDVKSLDKDPSTLIEI